MMMDNNKRLGIFIIGVAAIILIGMAIYVYIFNRNQQAANQAKTTASTTVASQADVLRNAAQKNQTPVTYKFDAKAEASRPLNAEDLKKLAMSFSERFGSYSNQANYSNFTDLKIFMTSKMSQWADSYVLQLKKADKNSSIYYGITTVAVSAQVNKFNDSAGQAEILVTTQRSETTASQATPRVFNQDILISLLKVKNDWKVDSAFWQK